MRFWIIPLTLALFFLAFSARAGAKEPLPSLAFREANGREHSLKQYRGKVVLLNFWATWCAPCLHELPVFSELYMNYSSKGLVILGASLDEANSRDAVDATARKFKISYPIFIDVIPEAMESFGVENVPATILLDREGRIVDRFSGEVDPVLLNRKIELLTSERHVSQSAHGANQPRTGAGKSPTPAGGEK